jgi:tetratricopeptide (TPR) repeat protein
VKILKKLFGIASAEVRPRTSAQTDFSPVSREESSESQSIGGRTPKKRKLGYSQEVKDKYGFDLPSCNTEKILLAQSFEKAGEVEKACACYEACVRNRFEGNGPYDRLRIIYTRQKRPEEAERVLTKAISLFEKLARTTPRRDVRPKLEKFKSQLAKIRQGYVAKEG